MQTLPFCDQSNTGSAGRCEEQRLEAFKHCHTWSVFDWPALEPTIRPSLLVPYREHVGGEGIQAVQQFNNCFVGRERRPFC